MVDLINNLTGNSHLAVLKELSTGATEISLISPYIFDNFDKFFNAISVESLNTIQLVTTLKTDGDDQLKKPYALCSFIENCTKFNSGMQCQIHFNNKLHGKIYIFHYGSGEQKAVITSANLTHSGLNNNHEWGVLIDDPNVIGKIEGEVMDSIEYADIPHEIIFGKMCSYADFAKSNLPKTRADPNIDASLIKILEQFAIPSNKNKQLSIENARDIFLKPHGDSERPILIENKFDFSDLTKLTFPHPKPKRMKPADILISFGTGCRAILCIHTALTGVEETAPKLQKVNADHARWPWFMNAYNHTPKFASVWWKYNITIDQLQDEYLAEQPDGQISKAGGKTLGSFNYGAGHLSINESFAQYVCRKILTIEAELTEHDIDVD